MPLAMKSDDNCLCGSEEVYEFTKAGETRRRLTCDECGREWSAPAK